MRDDDEAFTSKRITRETTKKVPIASLDSRIEEVSKDKIKASKGKNGCWIS